MIRRHNSLVLMILLSLLGLAACGRSGPGAGGEEPAKSAAHSFVDWDLVDWNFPRYGLVNSALSHPITHDISRQRYEEATRYQGPLGALDLAAFQALPPESREARRAVARNELHEAMAIQRVLWRSWEIWVQSRRAAVADEAFTYRDGLLTHALGHLETAAGLDPADPWIWYHLAVFRGFAGDEKRQGEAIDRALKLLPEVLRADEALMRLRLLLDAGWLARRQGRFEEGAARVDRAIDLIREDELKTLDMLREAQLLQALLMVNRGYLSDARQAARKLEKWPVPVQKTSAQSATFAATVMTKHNLEKIESDFAQNWVWAMTYLEQGFEEEALGYQNKQTLSMELPPHIGWRYWQDMGRLQEHFGHMAQADLCYAYALMHRPLLPFFPTRAGRGLSRIFNQAGTGRPYFLGYGAHFLVGSYFSYAANRVVALEIAPSPLSKLEAGAIALEALTNCLRQGIRPAAALALRGRTHYRLGRPDLAEKDLAAAHEMMASRDAESADVVKLLAVLHFDREDYTGALELLRRYSELEPRDAFGWRLGGVALSHLGRLQEARSSLDVALDMDPQAGAAWYNRALVHLRLGNGDRARQDLEYARRLMPGNDDVRRVAALIIDDPDTPIRLSSDPVELKLTRRDSLLYANVDRVTEPDLSLGLQEKELDRLTRSLEERFEMEPSSQNRLALARTLVRSGRQKEVQELLVPLWPDGLNLEEMKLLLRSDRALGLTRRAVSLARTLARDPHPVPDGDFWALVAVVCLENGRAEAGRLALDTALEMDPQNVALLRMRHGGG